MWLRGHKGTSLLVEKEQTVTLSADSEVPTVILRPRTVSALLVTFGILTPSPARLSDRDSFEILDTIQGYVNVKVPDTNGRIGGYTPSFLRAILTAFDPGAPVPQTVQIPGLQREGASASTVPRRHRNIGISRLNQIELPVPDLLTKFAVAVLVPNLINIVVDVNSTLYLNAGITHLMVNNFLCYAGARIVQQSNYLAADIYGTMQGSLINVIHDVKGKDLIINSALLSERATHN
jgi:hypothetical protein